MFLFAVRNRFAVGKLPENWWKMTDFGEKDPGQYAYQMMLYRAYMEGNGRRNDIVAEAQKKWNRVSENAWEETIAKTRVKQSAPPCCYAVVVHPT